MNISKLFRFVLCGFTLIAAANLGAQDRGQARGGRGGIEGLVQQLDLSDTQKDQLKAVFAESREARQAILAKHGIEMGKGVRPDREQMREAQPEIAALRKETESKAKALLSEEQLSKLEELLAANDRGGRAGGNRKKNADSDEE